MDDETKTITTKALKMKYEDIRDCFFYIAGVLDKKEVRIKALEEMVHDLHKRTSFSDPTNFGQ